MPTFQDRDLIVARICDFEGCHSERVIVLTGEAGIGKSRVLQESARRIRQHWPEAIVLSVDFAGWGQSSAAREELLRALISQSAGRLAGFGDDVDRVSIQITNQLSRLATERRVYVLCDTTEVLQEDKAFWRWFEASFLVPLVTDGQVRVILAGRIAAPLHHYDVRQVLYREALKPIEQTDAAALITEVAQEIAPGMPSTALEGVIATVQGLAFGHPLLSERLSKYIAEHRTDTSSPQYTAQLCAEVVEPFLSEKVYRRLEPPWAEILPLISILHWFDSTILRTYLEHVVPDLVTGKPDFFYVQGIAQLRIRGRVVWQESLGYLVEGVLGSILRRCLVLTHPDVYRRACAAAEQVFQEIADIFADDPEQAQSYLQEVAYYRQRCGDTEGGEP